MMGSSDTKRGLTTRLVALILLGGVAAGCNSFLPQSIREPAPKLYELSSPAPMVVVRTNQQLVVDAPLADRALDTDRIALKPNPLQIEYYAGSRWADRAPALVQGALVEAFENANALTAVGRPSLGLSPDFVLKSELRDFAAIYAKLGNAPEIRVRLTAKLIRQADRAVVSTRTFEARAPARKDSVAYAVEAFDRAMAQIVAEVLPWSIQSMNAAGPARQGLSQGGADDGVAGSWSTILRRYPSADLGDAAP